MRSTDLLVLEVEDTAATTPSDAAEGTAVMAVIVVGETPCDMGSPPQRAEERPARMRAAEEDADRMPN
jgi:hypothetical protein